MSFTCNKHSWQHLLSPCPVCPSVSSMGLTNVPTSYGAFVTPAITVQSNYMNINPEIEAKINNIEKMLEQVLEKLNK